MDMTILLIRHSARGSSSSGHYLKDNFTITEVGISSAGRKYLTPPDLVIYNSKTDQISDTTKFRVDLQGSGVSNVQIISGGSNLRSGDNKIVAINNSNGVGVNSVSLLPAGVVTCVLATPTLGFTTATAPFAVNDFVYAENISLASTTGTGFNSQDYSYNFFKVTAYRNTNPAEG